MRITKAMIKIASKDGFLNSRQIDFLVSEFGENWRVKLAKSSRVRESVWFKLLQLSGITDIEKTELEKLAILKKKRQLVKKKKTKMTDAKDNDFYIGNEWRRLRVAVLEKYQCKCMMCGRSPKNHGVVIHVDHIKPKSLYPELKLTETNLQILCEDCNVGKSNNYMTDYRPKDN